MTFSISMPLERSEYSVDSEILFAACLARSSLRVARLRFLDLASSTFLIGL